MLPVALSKNSWPTSISRSVYWNREIMLISRISPLVGIFQSSGILKHFSLVNVLALLQKRCELMHVGCAFCKVRISTFNFTFLIFLYIYRRLLLDTRCVVWLVDSNIRLMDMTGLERSYVHTCTTVRFCAYCS